MSGQVADLALSRARSIEHIVIDPDGVEHVLVRTTNRAVTLHLVGARLSRSPVRLKFLVDGLARSRADGLLISQLNVLLGAPPREIKRTTSQNMLRNGLIAIDGKFAGATYFEIASAIAGPTSAREDWSTWKEHVRRARTNGEYFRDGGYRELIR